MALFKGPPSISLIYRAGENRPPELFKIPFGKYNRNREGVCVVKKGGRRMEDRNEEVGATETEKGKKQAGNYELLHH